MAEIRITPASPFNGVTTCVNLRSSLSGDSLTAAAVPIMASEGSWQPLLSLDECIPSVLVSKGRVVGVYNAASVEVIGVACADIVCAVADSSSLITIMTSDGPEYLSIDGSSFVWLGPKPIFPEVRFEAVSHGVLSTTVAPYSFDEIDLSGTSAKMSSADIKAYSSRLRSAYSRLSTSAMAARMWIQPVMVRACYMDADGRILHACAPLIVGLPSGWQCRGIMSASVTRRSDSDATVDAFVLSAECYSISLKCDFAALPVAWRHRVAGVGLFVSPQIHPFGTEMESLMSWRIDNHRSNTPVLTFTLPGATSDFASLDDARLSEVAAMTARMFSPVTSRDFFGSFNEGLHVIGPYRVVTPQDEMSDLCAVASATRGTQPCDTRIAEITSPHSFSAGAGDNIGVWQIWGRITPYLFKGYSLCDMAVTHSDTAEIGSSRVSLIDSDARRHILERVSAVPVNISPLIVYPHPGAGSVTLEVITASDICRALSLTLRRVHGTGWSVYLHPNLAYICPGDFPVASTRSPVVDNGAMICRSDALAVTSRKSWTSPVSVTSCGVGAITAVTPGCRTSAGLDSGKMRGYVFATSGIFVTGINAKGILDSPMRIDIRPVMSRRHVSYSSEGAYATGSSGLVRLRGNTSTCIMNDFRADAIGVCPGSNELWHTDRSGNIHFLSLATLTDSVLDLPYQIETLTTRGSRLWLTGSDLLALAPDYDVTAADDTPFEWECRHHYGDIRIPRRLTIDMSAGWFTGDIEVKIDWGGNPADLMRLTVDGPVNAPISEALFIPLNYWTRSVEHPFFTFRIRGSATRLQLRSISLE